MEHIQCYKDGSNVNRAMPSRLTLADGIHPNWPLCLECFSAAFEFNTDIGAWNTSNVSVYGSNVSIWRRIQRWYWWWDTSNIERSVSRLQVCGTPDRLNIKLSSNERVINSTKKNHVDKETQQLMERWVTSGNSKRRTLSNWCYSIRTSSPFRTNHSSKMSLR